MNATYVETDHAKVVEQRKDVAETRLVREMDAFGFVDCAFRRAFVKASRVILLERSVPHILVIYATRVEMELRCGRFPLSMFVTREVERAYEQAVQNLHGHIWQDTFRFVELLTDWYYRVYRI